MRFIYLSVDITILSWHVSTPGPFTREAGFLGYNEICSELGGGGWEERWEPCHRAPYMVKRDKWVSFDNEQSVKLKADLAWDQRLAGVMVWSIETDDFQGLLCVLCFPSRL